MRRLRIMFAVLGLSASAAVAQDSLEDAPPECEAAQFARAMTLAMQNIAEAFPEAFDFKHHVAKARARWNVYLIRLVAFLIGRR